MQECKRDPQKSLSSAVEEVLIVNQENTFGERILE